MATTKQTAQIQIDLDDRGGSIKLSRQDNVFTISVVEYVSGVQRGMSTTQKSAVTMTRPEFVEILEAFKKMAPGH